MRVRLLSDKSTLQLLPWVSHLQHVRSMCDWRVMRVHGLCVLSLGQKARYRCQHETGRNCESWPELLLLHVRQWHVRQWLPRLRGIRMRRWMLIESMLLRI